MNALARGLLLASTLTACGGPRVVLHAEPVASPGVHVVPTEVAMRGSRFTVRVVVHNTSSATLRIQRDQIVVRLPFGDTVTREVGRLYLEGLWGAHAGDHWRTHDPDVLPPGASRPIDMEYEQRSFVWRDVPSVEVDFDGAITRDGARVDVPPLLVRR